MIIETEEYVNSRENNYKDAQCNCRKIYKPTNKLAVQVWYHVPNEAFIKKIQSTCSDAAASRGPNQKVISFVVYGDLEAFIDQVVKNMEQVEKFL